MTKRFDPRVTFGAAAVFAVVSAIILSVFVVEPRNSELIRKSIRVSHKQPTFVDKTLKEKIIFTFSVSWQSMKANPAIPISIMCIAFTRMHTNVNQSFMQLWLLHTDSGLDKPQA